MPRKTRYARNTRKIRNTQKTQKTPETRKQRTERLENKSPSNKPKSGLTQTLRRKQHCQYTQPQVHGVQVGSGKRDTVVTITKESFNNLDSLPDIPKPGLFSTMKSKTDYAKAKQIIISLIQNPTNDETKQKLCDKYSKQMKIKECDDIIPPEQVGFVNPLFAMRDSQKSSSAGLYPEISGSSQYSIHRPPDSLIIQQIIQKLNGISLPQNTKDCFIIFILTLEGIEGNICVISRYNNDKRTDFLMYIIKKCTQSERAGIKKNLKDGQFTVYESSERKFVICTNIKCYMEGEPDELKFKLIYIGNTGKLIKYFVLPRSVMPICTKVRYLHTGQTQCDINATQNYGTIYFDKPVPANVCGNKILFDFNTSTRSANSLIVNQRQGSEYSEPHNLYDTYMEVGSRSPEYLTIFHENSKVLEDSGYKDIDQNDSPQSHPPPHQLNPIQKKYKVVTEPGVNTEELTPQKLVNSINYYNSQIDSNRAANTDLRGKTVLDWAIKKLNLKYKYDAESGKYISKE